MVDIDEHIGHDGEFKCLNCGHHHCLICHLCHRCECKKFKQMRYRDGRTLSRRREG